MQHVGRKGIGFKSCFAITDRPHIISGPYRFCLSAHTPLAFVDPLWLSEADVSQLPQPPAQGGTTLYLPFKDDVKLGATLEVDQMAQAMDTLVRMGGQA